MKRLLLLVLIIISQISQVSAQKKEPKWIKKASKAIIEITTTTKEGTTKTGYGFFVSENGEAVSDYKLFERADKATITTAEGQQLNVTQILGADDIYDVVHFKVSSSGKTPFIKYVKTEPINGSIAYVLPPKEGTKSSQGAISEITKVNSTYNYYKIDMPLPSSQKSYPIMNKDGEVFAMTQADALNEGKTYGISISYIQNIKITSTDVFKREYSEIGIRKAWPPSAENAQLALMLYASQQDPKTYLETINDYISTFPEVADGYMTRASHYAYHRKELAETESEQSHYLDLALEDLNMAEKYTTKKGEAYYNKAKLILGVAASDSTITQSNWSIDAAKENIQKAIEEEDLPIYRQLEGDIEFYQKDYENAYNSYMAVNHSDIASGESYYYAAKSKQQTEGANLMEVITLLDSAIIKSKNNEASAYLLENVDLKMKLGLYDNAVKDYDKYFLINGGNVTDEFYYYREQAKFRANDLNGALQDIEKAISINDKEAIYQAEEASIYLRLKDPAKAQIYAQKAIEKQPDFASAHRILGISLLRQNKKAEACKSFTKAKELGDPIAEKLIKENCK